DVRRCAPLGAGRPAVRRSLAVARVRRLAAVELWRVALGAPSVEGGRIPIAADGAEAVAVGRGIDVRLQPPTDGEKVVEEAEGGIVVLPRHRDPGRVIGSA